MIIFAQNALKNADKIMMGHKQLLEKLAKCLVCFLRANKLRRCPFGKCNFGSVKVFNGCSHV